MKIDKLLLQGALSHAAAIDAKEYGEALATFLSDFEKDFQTLYILPDEKLEKYLDYKTLSDARLADIMELLQVFSDISNLTGGKAGITEIMKLATKKKPLEEFANRINAVAAKYITTDTHTDDKEEE